MMTCTPTVPVSCSAFLQSSTDFTMLTSIRASPCQRNVRSMAEVSFRAWKSESSRVSQARRTTGTSRPSAFASRASSAASMSARWGVVMIRLTRLLARATRIASVPVETPVRPGA
jgi:hypothetical protein